MASRRRRSDASRARAPEGRPAADSTVSPQSSIQNGGSNAAGEKVHKAASLPQDTLVFGNVWRLSRDPNGSRLIQCVLDDASGDDDRLRIASELHGHAWQAMRCSHANHVLQKCIMTMRPLDIQFIIDELNERGHAGICKAAQHEYACRVLQRLMEHCAPGQINSLIEVLLMDCTVLSRHIYGNFTMQHVLEYGSESQRHRLAVQLERHASILGWDHRGRKVLTKALSASCPADRMAIARALLMEPDLLVCMAHARHGHMAAQLMIGILDGEFHEEAKRQLGEELPSLFGSRYGRKIVGSMGQTMRSPGNTQCEGRLEKPVVQQPSRRLGGC
mmetsp:Transcript_87015/g.224031  ORF Transcript_87015/g.224031 Transcript_87015/m.224031 type:complete len:332 (+) Transcript_87015:102-1097(+)